MPKGALRKTEVFKIDPKNPDAEAITRMANLIRRGGLVAFPTETVYGIAANFSDNKAIDRLYEVKKRFRSKPFTVHISDLITISEMGCTISRKARRAIDRFWPGALTILLKNREGGKIGFRMPANEVALRLIRESKVPIVAPSANISGNKPPKDAKTVLEDLDGSIDALLDAGRTEVGIESTVVDFTVEPPIILREGAVSKSSLYAALKRG